MHNQFLLLTEQCNRQILTLLHGIVKKIFASPLSSGASKDITVLKVKSEDGNHMYLVTMFLSETVGHLRSYLDKHRWDLVLRLWGTQTECTHTTVSSFALQSRRAAWLPHHQRLPTTPPLQRRRSHSAIMRPHSKHNPAAAGKTETSSTDQKNPWSLRKISEERLWQAPSK